MAAQTTNRTVKQQVAHDIQSEVYDMIKTKFEAYIGNEPYIFISYSHRDIAKVYPILDALHDRKYRIWYDESCEVGNDFRDELRHRIENSNAVVVFVSKWSMSSPFCGMEIVVAKENRKKIIPIFLDNEELPPAFQLVFSNTHHATADDMSKLMKSLKDAIPPETMDRLEIKETKLESCADNGESIEIPDMVKEIGDNAFKERRLLKKIALSSTLETIGNESFRGCSQLEGMEIPESTRKIGESAFRDCTRMKSLKIKNNCIKIGERAFENCSSLEEVELPMGLTEIYGGVFNSCKQLRKIQLPEKLTILGESAFSDCVSLESVEIPATVTKIDDLAFNGCISLSKVVLHEGLKKIGKSAFKNCSALTEVTFPVSITSVSNAPFRGCKGLKTIKVESKNKYFKSEPNKRDGKDHVLFNKNKSVIIAYPASAREIQYDIPDSVISISDWAFCDCEKLSRITIPDSIHEIGEGAFSNCLSLDEVHIPDSVTLIDDCAFRGCEKLERIWIPSSVTELGWGIFDGCEKITVYCEANSAVEQYCVNNGIKVAGYAEAE